MKCLFLKRLKNRAYSSFDDYYIHVGCGKCYSCLCNRRRAWLFRLGNESLDSFLSVFVTLTYSDDSLPPALVKDHLLDFLNQLNFRFTYYAIGEYGPKTLRPHYHAVLFIKHPLGALDLQRHFEACWSRGFVTCSVAHYYRLNYILHYHVRPKRPAPGLETFQLYSKGLGLNFLYDRDGNVKPALLAYLCSGGRVVQDLEGNYYVIPRYYIRKLETLGLLDPKSFKWSDNHVFDDYMCLATNLQLYQITDYRWNNLVHDLVYKSTYRIYNYNMQNKYLTCYE